jgi:hypothetical protein
MKHTHINTFILLLFAGIVLFAGCNKARIPGLAKCEGVVTWNGDPVEGARVEFIPKDNANGRSAFGITDAQGKFKTTTLDTDDGIMPGEYFVTVTKRTSTRGGAPPAPVETASDAPREGRNAPPPAREEMQVTYFIPQVYSKKETSGLTADIPAKGTRDLTFELVGEIASTPTR